MAINRTLVAGLAALGLLWGASSVQAQGVPNPLITVDENGNGTIQFAGGPVMPLPGVLAPDPGPGGLPLVLTYDLGGPPAIVPGDVLLVDPDGITLSDVVRFNEANTGGLIGYPASLVFYSNPLDGFDSLADTPAPPGQFYPNTVVIPEVGPAGNNGAIYTPGPNDPGFVPGFTVTYDIVSDVPEPGSIAFLVGLGVTGAAFLRRKRAR